MKAFTIAKRLVKQILGDKRSIALLFIAPIFVLTLLSMILNVSAPTPNIKVNNIPNDILVELKKEGNISEFTDEQEAIKDLKNKKIDALIKYHENKITIILEGSEPSVTKNVLNAFNKAISKVTNENLSKLLKTIPKNSSLPVIEKPETIFLTGSEDMTMFDSVAPMLMGFFVFFFVFLLAGVSFLRERISGTLDRILATPLKRKEIVYGYFLGFGVFVAIQTLIIQLFMVYGLKINIMGSFWTVLIINLLLASGSLALGTLLSTFAKNEFQLFQFIPIVIVPQVLFSGIFDLRKAPDIIIILSKLFPMTYGAEALKDVVVRGKGFLDIKLDLFILLLYAIAFLWLNILALKKYRKI